MKNNVLTLANGGQICRIKPMISDRLTRRVVPVLTDKTESGVCETKIPLILSFTSFFRLNHGRYERQGKNST